MTAAHPCLPFGTVLEVEDLSSGRMVRVRINDRGPFKPGRQIDLSEAAASRLGLDARGLGRVRLSLAAPGAATARSAASVCPSSRPCLQLASRR